MTQPAGDDPWGGPSGSALDKDFAELMLRAIDSGRELMLAELQADEARDDGQRNKRIRAMWGLHDNVLTMIERERNRRFLKAKKRQDSADKEPWEQDDPDGDTADDDDDV